MAAVAVLLVGAFVLPASAFDGKPVFLDLCHFDAVTGMLEPISVPQQGLDAHLNNHAEDVLVGDGVDENCDPVPILVQTVQVSALGDATQILLEDGNSYELRASGTYVFGPGPQLADAQCVLVSGVWYEDLAFRFGSMWTPPFLEVGLDGADAMWQPNTCQTTTHEYSTLVAGDGSLHDLRIDDSFYGDNSGFITVEVWLLP
jgi:hypothetical protein